ncbi:toxin PIN domain [Candidatus Termititenax aidoneus]|uniref:Toxin PIN domain n=1 Tax=Termititenax aidoneus TaxID=2218524 RepID=A0A388TC76_TERA1|nr:toxin PIN domain [Candidatus Termititenax aidoneus]
MTYILDACALIAYLTNELGAEFVEKILINTKVNPVIMHKVNLLEIYYGFFRDYGQEKADELLKDIPLLDLKIIDGVSDKLFREAGRLKATYKLSLADAICLAQAQISGATVVSSDHHEFDVIEQHEALNFAWLR